MPDKVILIIEDDLHIGGLVAQVLREAGYRPELVRDVHTARAEAARGTRPAAVISDLMVAGSAGPAKLAAELGGLFPGTPLTLMTGVPPKRRAALGVKHDRIIEKPFELEALLTAAGAMLGPASGRRSRGRRRSRPRPRRRLAAATVPASPWPSATSTACTAA